MCQRVHGLFSLFPRPLRASSCLLSPLLLPSFMLFSLLLSATHLFSAFLVTLCPSISASPLFECLPPRFAPRSIRGYCLCSSHQSYHRSDCSALSSYSRSAHPTSLPTFHCYGLFSFHCSLPMVCPALLRAADSCIRSVSRSSSACPPFWPFMSPLSSLCVSFLSTLVSLPGWLGLLPLMVKQTRFSEQECDPTRG